MVGDLAFMPTRYGSKSMDKVYGSSLLPVIGNDDTLNFRLFPFAHMNSNPQELDRHIRTLLLIYGSPSGGRVCPSTLLPSPFIRAMAPLVLRMPRALQKTNKCWP